MYPVSADYLTAIAKNARAHKLTGYIDGHVFDGGDVIRGSFAVKNQLCSQSKIELGGVYVGELDLTFSTAFAQGLSMRGAWRGKVITASIGVELADSSFEYIPMGIFTIDNAVWTDTGIQIAAYDNMSKFDTAINFNVASGTLYSWLTYICSECNVTLGMTQADIEALPNGLETLAPYPGNTMETYRDMLSALAQASCTFATINRSGELELRPLPGSTVTATITHKQRYSTSFSDYSSFYSVLEVTHMEDDTVMQYENDNVGGLIMNIGANPFIQYGVPTTYEAQRQAIIDALEDFNAVPFNVSILPNPALDLGDLIQFSGGIGQNSLGCIMSFTMKIDSTTIEGYGENPAALGVTSAVEKSLSSASKNSKENLFTYYTSTNLDSITLTTVPTKIIDIEFGCIETTNVELWHELKTLNSLINSTQSITYKWYLDGDELSYEPVDTFGESGYHTEPHPYWLLDVEGGTAHQWEVYAYTDSGTATLDPGDVHALLKGQKMIAEDAFKGDIELTDTFTAITAGGIVAPITDDPAPEFDRVSYGDVRITEAGDTRVTESGDTRILE